MLKNNGGRIKIACMTSVAGDSRGLSVLHKERAKKAANSQICLRICGNNILLMVPE